MEGKDFNEKSVFGRQKLMLFALALRAVIWSACLEESFLPQRSRCDLASPVEENTASRAV
jgi:hypothetical protein